jgi:hypothetical protein
MELVGRCGFEVTLSQCEYVQRDTVNKKEGLCVPRVFTQGRFIKPKSTQQAWCTPIIVLKMCGYVHTMNKERICVFLGYLPRKDSSYHIHQTKHDSSMICRYLKLFTCDDTDKWTHDSSLCIFTGVSGEWMGKRECFWKCSVICRKYSVWKHGNILPQIISTLEKTLYRYILYNSITKYFNDDFVYLKVCHSNFL